MRNRRFIFPVLCVLAFCLILIRGEVCAERGIRIQKIGDLNHENGSLGTYKALIIGINDYEGSRIPDLETAVKNATAMAKILKNKYGFQFRLILDRDATKETIYKELRRLAVPRSPMTVY